MASLVDAQCIREMIDDCVAWTKGVFLCPPYTMCVAPYSVRCIYFK